MLADGRFPKLQQQRPSNHPTSQSFCPLLRIIAVRNENLAVMAWVGYVFEYPKKTLLEFNV